MNPNSNLMPRDDPGAIGDWWKTELSDNYDITYPVNVVSLFILDPQTSHWDVVRILGYL